MIELLLEIYNNACGDNVERNMKYSKTLLCQTQISYNIYFGIQSIHLMGDDDLMHRLRA